MDNGSRSDKVIDIGRGLFAIVDISEYEDLSKYKWHPFFKDGHPVHAYRYERTSTGKYVKIRMHHHIFGKPKHGYVWDHINGNSLDNRSSNLRHITQLQNMQNQRVRRIKNRPNKPKSSKFKGVSYSLVHKKDQLSRPWRARIRVRGFLVNLGWFKTEEEAALAYNYAASGYFGEYASLNEINYGVEVYKALTSKCTLDVIPEEVGN